MTAKLGGARVAIDPVKLANYLRSPDGPVLRDLIKRGDRVKDRARQLVGVKTGNLRDHIVKTVVYFPGGAGGGTYPGVQVGFSGVPYGIFHHEGTVPHVIVPKRATVLAFQSGGRMVFAKRVQHPGTRANRFLINALPAAR